MIIIRSDNQVCVTKPYELAKGVKAYFAVSGIRRRELLPAIRERFPGVQEAHISRILDSENPTSHALRVIEYMADLIGIQRDFRPCAGNRPCAENGPCAGNPNTHSIPEKGGGGNVRYSNKHI